MLCIKGLSIMAESVNAHLLVPRELGFIEKSIVQIAVDNRLPRFVTAEMSSEAGSKFLGDASEKMCRSIGGVKVSEVIIQRFPVILTSQALPKMQIRGCFDFAMGADRSSR